MKVSATRSAILVLAVLGLTGSGTALAAGHAPTHETMAFHDRGTSPMDDPTFVRCVGYAGRIFEGRDGTAWITEFSSGPNAGTAHLTAHVTATIRFFPRPGASGTVYTGTYREQDEGWFSLPSFDPVGNAEFHVNGSATSADGRTIHFRIWGHLFVNKQTGDLRREVEGSACS